MRLGRAVLLSSARDGGGLPFLAGGMNGRGFDVVEGACAVLVVPGDSAPLR